MNITFETTDLAKMAAGEKVKSRFSKELLNLFRKRIATMRIAPSESDLSKMGGLNYEKLVARKGEWSIRIDRQWRIVFRRDGDTLHILRIEDYH